MHIELNVFDLAVHQSSNWLFNCYVIEGDDGSLVVVDPGLRSTAAGALEIVQQLDRASGDISTLTCTHGHSDHVGAMPTLLDAGIGAAHLPGPFERFLAGDEPRVFGADATVRFLAMYPQQPFSLGAVRDLAAGRKVGYGTSSTFSLPFTPSGFLADGDRLPGASEWEAISTPGHSDCSTSYYHRASETLLSGDAVLTLDGAPWFNPEWVDAGQSEETAERLRSLPVRHLFPGHGRPIHGDVWAGARSFRTKPGGSGLLARCARRAGRWDY